VRWKTANRIATTAISTATMPIDSTEIRTPARSNDPSPNRLGKARLPKPQIQPARLLTRM
jgi:hypothetical protein